MPASGWSHDVGKVRAAAPGMKAGRGLSLSRYPERRHRPTARALQTIVAA